MSTRKDAITQLMIDERCTTGTCEHHHQAACFRHLIGAGYDAAMASFEVMTMRNALQYYAAMRFNREKMDWMPGGPDKAINALSVFDRAREAK